MKNTFFEKYKEFDKKLDEKLPLYSVRQKTSKYFTKPIFWIAFTLIFAVVGINFVLNHYSFVQVSLSCPSSFTTPCTNPFYVSPTRNIYEPQQTMPQVICNQVPCDREFIQPGESFGRTDFFARNGFVLMVTILFVALLVNHFVYLMRKENGSS